VQGYGIGCGVLFLLLSVCFMYLLYRYRDVKVVRNSQPRMCGVLLLGMLLGSVQVLLSSSSVTVARCQAQDWLQQLSYRMVFGSFLLKLWRVHMVVNSTTSFKRVRISEEQVMRYLLYLILSAVLLLVPITALSGYTVVYDSWEESNQMIYEAGCGVNESDSAMGVSGTALQYILNATQALILCMGVWYVWMTRSVPAAISETIVVGKCKYGY
jgi:hypothetical protein